MTKFIRLLVLMFLWFCYESVRGLTVRKFVYQKDMSEHCRRRVVPSVFLGRHVTAHSQILHFSKMELPYSCFISIRAESGSNIVLVVQLLSDQSLTNACSESASQLLVYDMAETFGGYWGPIPDSVIRQNPVKTKPYTLRTTQPSIDRLQQRKPQILRPNPETTIRVEHTSNVFLPLSHLLKSDSKDTAVNEIIQETTTEATPLLGPTSKQQPTSEQQEFIRVEVPIVEVSGKLVPGSSELMQPALDSDEAFDLAYDVTPRPHVQYRTSILPVVQFGLKHGWGGKAPRFDLDYEIPVYTPDARLKIPLHTIKTTKRWRNSRTNYFANRHLNFKNIRTTIRPTKKTSYYLRSNLLTKGGGETSVNNLFRDKFNTSLKSKSTYDTIKNPNTTQFSNWDYIENLMRNLRNDTLDGDHYRNKTENISSSTQTISNVKLNNSIYLHPDWASLITLQDKKFLSFTQMFSSFTRKPFTLFTYGTKMISILLEHATTPTVLSTKTEKMSIKQDLDIEISTTTKVKDTVSTLAANVTITAKTKTVFGQNNSDSNNGTSVIFLTKENLITAPFIPNTEGKATTSRIRAPLTGSLVNHESWENVVQAAPEMASLLNQTDNTSAASAGSLNSFEDDHDTLTKSKDNTPSFREIRKKRTIQPIPIENARPHKLTTTEFPVTDTAVAFDLTAMQDFAQLVELTDDELHDRLALRYLRQYVGPTLFNICDSGEPKARHVFLFNSSRVVIAINNFTLDRMTVMLTPAHTLFSGRSRCSADSLECQVYGTRICIDNMNACDGVPNCGVYDIYDEDRLMCGAAVGLQHNVHLAAITFLAVLLTVMYTVHYWLRRCVPRVSEAFFIYTNGTENVLYLETIMRSPYDTEDANIKMESHGTDDDLFNSENPDKSDQHIFFRMIHAFIKCCKSMSTKKGQPEYNMDDEGYKCNYNEPEKRYSFAEMELRNMIHSSEVTDAAIQTGDSLEMTYFQHLPGHGSEDSRIKSANNNIQRHVNELNILKFFNDVKSESKPLTSRRDAVIVKQELIPKYVYEEEEEEVQVQFYDPQSIEESPEHTPHRIITTTCDVHPEKPESSKRVKCLRFDEEAVAIPCDYDEDDDDAEQLSYMALSDGKNNEPVKTGESHQGSSVGRDFKRFWKSKKPKKKTHP